MVKSNDGVETVSEKASSIWELLRSRMKPTRTGGTWSSMRRSAIRPEAFIMTTTGLRFISAMAEVVIDINVLLSFVASSRSCLMLFKFELLSIITITGPLGPGVPAVSVTMAVSFVSISSLWSVICDGSREEALTLSEKVRVRVSLFKLSVKPSRTGDTKSWV